LELTHQKPLPNGFDASNKDLYKKGVEIDVEDLQ